MQIRHPISNLEREQLDELLWDILWKPLGLTRQVRKNFKLDSPQIDLIAVNNDTVIAGLVANWISEKEIEIRHIVVVPQYQRQTLGKALVGRLIDSAQKNFPVKITTWARNTSKGFFGKLGFAASGKQLEHEAFVEHGIVFHQMSLAAKPSEHG